MKITKCTIGKEGAKDEKCICVPRNIDFCVFYIEAALSYFKRIDEIWRV